MKNGYRYVIIGLLTIPLLTACGGIYVVDPIYKTQQLPENRAANGSNKPPSMYVVGEQMIDNESSAFQDAFTKAQSDKAARNQLLIRIRLLSDEICKKHLGDIRGTATGFNLTFGTLTTLFSGTAALSTGTTAKTLAAAAAASNASRSLVSEEVYRQAFSDSIVRAVEADRKLKRQTIETGLGQSRETYSIEQGILDIQDYHDRCSFLNGVGILSQAVEKRGVVTKEDIVARLDVMRQEMKKTDDTIKSLSSDDAKKGSLHTQNAQMVEEILRLQKLLATSPQ